MRRFIRRLKGSHSAVTPGSSVDTIAGGPLSRRWRLERRIRELPLETLGGVEFYALEPDDLDNVSIVAQAVDNQWVSRRLLSKMLASRNVQGLADVRS